MTAQLFTTLLAVLIPSLALWDIARRWLASGGQLAAHTAMLTAAHQRIDDLDIRLRDERHNRSVDLESCRANTHERVSGIAEALGKRIDLLSTSTQQLVDAHDAHRNRIAKLEELKEALEQHNAAQRELAIEWLGKFRELEKQMAELTSSIDTRVAGTLAQAGSVGGNGNYFRNPGG